VTQVSPGGEKSRFPACRKLATARRERFPRSPILAPIPSLKAAIAGNKNSLINNYLQIQI
jgi:hypothetical protein